MDGLMVGRLDGWTDKVHNDLISQTTDAFFTSLQTWLLTELNHMSEGVITNDKSLKIETRDLAGHRRNAGSVSKKRVSWKKWKRRICVREEITCCLAEFKEKQVWGPDRNQETANERRDESTERNAEGSVGEGKSKDHYGVERRKWRDKPLHDLSFLILKQTQSHPYQVERWRMSKDR